MIVVKVIGLKLEEFRQVFPHEMSLSRSNNYIQIHEQIFGTGAKCIGSVSLWNGLEFF